MNRTQLGECWGSLLNLLRDITSLNAPPVLFAGLVVFGLFWFAQENDPWLDQHFLSLKERLFSGIKHRARNGTSGSCRT